MERIFIDTGGFYALADKRELSNHEKAKELFLRKDALWFSSNYIFDELATLLLYRASKSISILFLDGIKKSEKIELLQNFFHYLLFFL